MRTSEKAESWVVYKMSLLGKVTEGNAVCEQTEWDRMQQVCPGLHTLVRSGIPSEGEAERLARKGPGEG